MKNFPINFAEFFNKYLYLLLTLFIILNLSQTKAQDNFPNVLRVATHSSFSLDKKLLQEFEEKNHCKIEIIKVGDAGQLINKLILTRKSPIADVVYGIDNVNQNKAIISGIIKANEFNVKTKYLMAKGLTAINFGWVTINIHKKYFSENNLELPQSLEELSQKKYQNLLVVEHPATSSVGLAFFLATYQYFGEEKVWQFWQQLKANGVKITKDWTQAYQKEFSQNGGAYPLVISYHTSPAAEVFYAKEKPATAPTASLWLDGSYFFQVEGMGLISGGNNQALAQKFIDFMLSENVQKNLQTQMWMQPANENINLVPEFVHIGEIPVKAQAGSPKDYPAGELQRLVDKWIKVMR